jgi:Flp pilus assembly protein TadG
MRLVRFLARLDRRGAAAAEMALVAPLLLTIMFGSLDLVTKAVRDGARFASRQNFATMPCGGSAANEAQIKNLVRFGKTTVTGTDKPRLHYWTSNSTITVEITCYANAGVDGARIYDGVYSARPQVPIVRVRAAVPYDPIVASFGFDASSLSLNAYSESTVFGL